MHYRGQRGVGVYDVAFEGLIKNVERRYRETGSDSTKQEYETFMRVTPCQACHGQRLKPTSLGVTVGDKNIFEVTSLSIDNLQKFMQNLELSEQQLLIGKQILKEIRARVSFLADVGLDYLTLARANGHRCPAVRRRESVWQRRSAPALSVSPIFWTSRASVFTRETTTNFSRR